MPGGEDMPAATTYLAAKTRRGTTTYLAAKTRRGTTTCRAATTYPAGDMPGGEDPPGRLAGTGDGPIPLRKGASACRRLPRNLAIGAGSAKTIVWPSRMQTCKSSCGRFALMSKLLRLSRSRFTE